MQESGLSVCNLGLIIIISLTRLSCGHGEVITCEDTSSRSGGGGDSEGKSGQLSNSDVNVNDTVSCTLETRLPGSNRSLIAYDCYDEETLRVAGDYGVIRISCTAPFPLDLQYDGFQPTEAIQVLFSKDIEPKSSRKLIAYKLEIQIRSVQALYDLYGQRNKENGRTERHVTSRTGRYTIHDVFNKTRQKTMYLFLEDEPDALSLMRNKFSTSVIRADGGDDGTLNKEDVSTRIIVPCRPSHLYANVSLFIESGNETLELFPNGRDIIYSPKEGFTVANVQAYLKNDSSSNVDAAAAGGPAPAIPATFRCKVIDDIPRLPKHRAREGSSKEGKANAATENEPTMRTLEYVFPPDPDAPQFGFEGLPTGSIQENINIHPQIVVVDDYSFQLSIDCTVENPVDAVLTVIEARTPSHSHLLQEFVFPKYINGSYNGVIGVKSSPPGVLTVRRAGLAGLIFCMSRRLSGNETDYKVLEYATGFDRKVRFFKYGQDWSFFDVTASPARNHLQVLPGTLQSGSRASSSAQVTYYVNQIYTFKCRVRIHGLAPPVIWYHEFDNGTIIEEFLDYNLDSDNFSHFNLTITNSTKEIYAAASFWDRELWKNVSTPIQATRKEGQTPMITNENFDIQFTYGATSQVLKCEATGDPKPDLMWEKDSKVLAKENGTDSLILEFSVINYSHSGNYICKATNILGSTSRIFTVQVVDEEHVNYIVSIGIPSLVFIIATVGTYLYFRFIRKEPVGLTAKEIEAFEQGSPEFTKEMEGMVPDNALSIPYDKTYEIEEKNYQIDETSVLGSGQFGIVYKGIVKGHPVAVKTLKANADKEYLKALLSELKIMCYLGKHDHLIELIGANTTKLKKGNLHLFVELCAEGSLEHHLRKNRPHFIPDLESEYTNTRPSYVPNGGLLPNSHPFNTQQLYIWSYQISKAMEYLALKKVIHGDLATRNVLLTSNFLAKVTDFGLSRQLYNYELYVKKNQEPLPWRWMAVESLRDLVFSVHSDAWSFGVTMWEIFTLAEVPYPGLAWDLEFIQKLEHGLRMLKPRYGTQKFYEEILLPCWHTDPECRPSFESISQYILSLIAIPVPDHYIRHADLPMTNVNGNIYSESLMNGEVLNEGVMAQKNSK